MEEETNVEAVAQPAEEVVTDNQESESQVSTDEGEQSAYLQEEDKPRPRGVQKRIDEITREKYEASRERDYWRNIAMQNQAAQPPVYQEPLYNDAYTGQEYYAPPPTIEELTAKVKAELQAAQEKESFSRKANDFLGKIKDPDTIDFIRSDYSPITKQMADVLLTSEHGDEVAVYLARNQSEAVRISSLPAHIQGYEISKIEAKVITSKSRQTNAPAPVPTLGGSAKPEIDPDKLPMNEWVKWRQSNLGKA